MRIGRVPRVAAWLEGTESRAARRILVFSDLDGTLLDHHSYSYADAEAALRRLQALQIPLILNSSKTRGEIKALLDQLGVRHPYAVENGAAVIVPGGYFSHLGETDRVELLGTPRERVLATLARLRRSEGCRFRGFADFSAEELADETGLPVESARLAKMRLGSEPIQWCDSEEALQRFREALAQAGLQLIRGGRFLHVMGPGGKAVAMEWLLRQYRRAHSGIQFFTVALGDAPNDRGMLERADIAVVIAAETGAPLPLKRHGPTLRTSVKGPRGWQGALDALLTHLI